MWEKKTQKEKKNVNNLVGQAKIRKLKYVTRVLTAVTARSKCIVLFDVKAVHAINCVNFEWRRKWLFVFSHESYIYAANNNV